MQKFKYAKFEFEAQKFGRILEECFHLKFNLQSVFSIKLNVSKLFSFHIRPYRLSVFIRSFTAKVSDFKTLFFLDLILILI